MVKRVKFKMMQLTGLPNKTGLEREWLESEFVQLPAVNGKKAQAWVEFVGSCAK